MPVTKRAFAFLGIIFGLCCVGGIGALFLGRSAVALVVLGPAVAALACAVAFERGRRIEALGLHFEPNWWWLAALLLPFIPDALSVALTILLSDRSYMDIGEAIAGAAQTKGQDTSHAVHAFLLNMSAGALFFLPFSLAEELGWRGYLYYLWRPFGFWRSSLATGLAWGAWHAPLILLYGLNYPDHRVLGAIVLFPLYCVLFGPILAVLRDRSGSIWAVVIFHATSNAIAALTVITLGDPSFPWNGILGIGGFVALALLNLVIILLHLDRLPEHARGEVDRVA